MKSILRLLLFLSMFIFFSCQKGEKLITIREYRQRVEDMYNKTRELAKGREKELFSVMDSGLTRMETDAMKFILAYAPLSDLADYDGSYFLSQVRTTLRAREEMPWGKSIPEEVFLHFILPVRVNNENLDTFRSGMYEELKARVKGMNLHDAALEVNHWCHEKVTYKGSDERTSSPLASMRTSWGRCGEESTFTVAALRTVGIPARQVYTPRWAHVDDNHAWVEVWVNGKWYFMGACEPDAELNMGWFAESAKRTMLVHTRAYGYYLGSEPVIDRQERFAELNLIGNYAPCTDLKVTVTDQNNKPVPDAKVEYRLYNYAEFFPIARSKTDKDGKTSVRMGLGDILVWAGKDKQTAWKKVNVKETSSVTLALSSQVPLGKTEFLDIVPPSIPEPVETNVKGQEANKARFEKENEIRNRYMATFRDTAWMEAFAVNNGLPKDSTVVLFQKACGNWMEVSKCLEKTAKTERGTMMGLLFTLTDKDIRDLHADVILDHLAQRPKNLYPSLKDEGKDLYLWYVISPRIDNEGLRPWRAFLSKEFSSLKITTDETGVQKLISWMKGNIQMDAVSNLHSRAPLSPRGMVQLKTGDARSGNILFVAVCRSLGIAARVNPVTKEANYYLNNQWNTVKWEQSQTAAAPQGYLHLLSGNTRLDPKYTRHFTISRLQEGTLKLYEFTEDMKLSEFPDRIALEAGTYLLTTGNRMTDGGVLSSLTFFEVTKDQLTDLLVTIREPSLEMPSLAPVNLKDFIFTLPLSPDAKESQIFTAKQPMILVWIESDQEPSRHVLVDIPLAKDALEAWKGRIVFLLKDEEKTPLPEESLRKKLPANSVFVKDENNALLSFLIKQSGKSISGRLPLIIYLDHKGKSWLVSEGYTIGIGDVLTRMVGTTSPPI